MEKDWFRYITLAEQAVMHQVFEKIKEKAPKGVTFNKERLTNYLQGGTCSAATFAFIKKFLQGPHKKLQDNLHYALDTYMENSELFRAKQIAFNTIEKCMKDHADDFKRAKIQSIANYYDIQFDFASQELSLQEVEHNPHLLNYWINCLPNGSYVGRILQLENNYKGEFWGHTVFYLKDLEGNFFYDPNYGLIELCKNEPIEHLYIRFNLIKEIWTVDNFRFYKIK